MRIARPLALFVCLTSVILLLGCAQQRAPIPPGTIPSQKELPSSDEQYGHEVYSSLSEQFPVEGDDSKVARVEKIVDRLTSAGKANHNPWHVVVFKDATFKNAAATRGNYVFVWSALIDAVKSDAELATVVAHEIGHVLAGHTDPDPNEELSSILAGVAGRVAGEVAWQQGAVGPLASLADALIAESVKALVVNPESQRKELEADEIGLFLMADAGYDPQAAVEFWKRAMNDPDFAGFPIEFLSSHPSSVSRSDNLEKYLAEASLRYQQASDPSGASSSSAAKRFPELGQTEIWRVAEEWATIYKTPHTDSDVAIDLPKNTKIEATPFDKRWLRVVSPVEGYVRGRDLIPE